MMCSTYKLNEHGGNIQPWHSTFPNFEPVRCSMVLTVASWPAYRFLRRQVRWSGIPISLWIFHNLLWPHSQDFGAVNKAKVDISANNKKTLETAWHSSWIQTPWLDLASQVRICSGSSGRAVLVRFLRWNMCNPLIAYSQTAPLSSQYVWFSLRF